MMRSWVCWLLPWVLLCCTTPAPPGATPKPSASNTQSAQRAPEAQHRVFLWRTESASATVFLLGSIHVGAPSIYPLDPRIERAFQASDTLVLEADTDDERMPELMAQFIEQALLPKGQSVYDSLERDLAVRLMTRLIELGRDPHQLSGFKLWFVNLVLAFEAMRHAGYTGEHGIDQHFKARAGNRRVLFLERIEDQIQLLLQTGDDVQAQDLERALEHDDAAFLTKSFEEWQRGELTTVEREMVAMRRDYPLAFEQLFSKRNQLMADGIVKFLEGSGRFFVVVGSGHLVGEGNVLELLRQRGFELEQQ